MIKDGILGKFGKPTEQTPKNWKEMLYDVNASLPAAKVGGVCSRSMFVDCGRFQRPTDAPAATEESKSEKKKKEKKHKLEDDDDDNQMQTSSALEETAGADASAVSCFRRSTVFHLSRSRFRRRRPMQQARRNIKSTRRRAKKIPISIAESRSLRCLLHLRCCCCFFC